ncbi:chemotaxis protein CheD [Spongisporangium articulatum]|uniref:Probable chemoreceptor glutamine deamidase CheD n=1 Tax=Spongisporangium articulatum TaxID=3362603 RepID=A0ABW8AM60_9ACTN
MSPGAGGPAGRDHPSPVVLHPGDFFFGRAPGRVETLLGSCVAITLWHPALHVGGMCHYLLPSRSRTGEEAGRLDGRYADEALEMFRRSASRLSTDLDEYVVKMFGGGRQFDCDPVAHRIDVPARNVAAGRALLRRAGLVPAAEHVGGVGPRTVRLNLHSGRVEVRHAGADVPDLWMSEGVSA